MVVRTNAPKVLTIEPKIAKKRLANLRKMVLDTKMGDWPTGS
jgi:hypothetical protein